MNPTLVAQTPPFPALLPDRQPLAPNHWLSTPGRLQLLGAAIAFSGLLLLLAARHAAFSARQALQTVGKDSAPSIVAAMQIRASVADLDANLVNTFLTAPEGKDRENARQAVDKRRTELSQTLVRAAQNITFGDAERGPIESLVRGLPAYEAGMSRALTLEETGDHAGAVQAAREASAIVRNSLAPAAEALEMTNRNALSAAYVQASASLGFTSLWLLGAFALTAAALLATQVYLFRRTRRAVNLGLALATVITIGFSIPRLGRVARAKVLLREAKQDAFDSVSLLWRIRVLANEANGLESRWLFDQAEATASARLFFANLDEIVRRPPGTDWALVPGEMRRPAASAVAGYDGLLVRALKNVTYSGERVALLQMVDGLAAYGRIDGRIRELQTHGDSTAAVALCLSDAPDGSNGAFDRFDAALEHALQINQGAFDERIQNGLEAVAGMEWSALTAYLAILGASAAGLWPRLQEYRR